ncbi:MAG: oleate hydratase, partial [Ignavibacteriae bacterium]|nr:oleate hydratase [Ignavibacteriota bacterium]
MARCLIIGGGLAGLSTAVYLSKAGHQIELIEATNRLGGRTFSFFDEETQTEIDNGQHILMGAYTHTLDLIEPLETKHLLDYQKNLNAVFYKKKNKRYTLDASKYFYPFNLLTAIWNFDALSNKEKTNFIKFVSSFIFINSKKLKKISILEWLKSNGQSENSIKSFWEILAVGALNTSLEDGSAFLFFNMLKEIFYSGNKASTIIIPNAGLSKTFIAPILNYLQKTTFEFSLSEKVEKINIENNLAKEIITNKRRLTEFDNVILTIPLYNLINIECAVALFNKEKINWESSSIISVTLWLKENSIEDKFFALIDSPIQWVFNHGKYYVIVISDANKFNDLSNKEIIEICLHELESYNTNFERDFVTNS